MPLWGVQLPLLRVRRLRLGASAEPSGDVNLRLVRFVVAFPFLLFLFALGLLLPLGTLVLRS